MSGPHQSKSVLQNDRSRATLDWMLGLLAATREAPPPMEELLRGLALASNATAAGFAGSADETPVVRARIGLNGNSPSLTSPWKDAFEQSRWQTRALEACLALPAKADDGSSLLLTAGRGVDGQSWLLWVEDHEARTWSETEASAFFIVGQALARLTADVPSPMLGLPRQAIHQRRLEETALVAGRLAHDYGNVLTGILGFSELSLSLLTPNAPAYQYATEVHRAAQQGADCTRRLRWFSRRGSGGNDTSSLADAISQEEDRLRQERGPVVQVQVSVPDDLPPVAMESDSLSQVIRQVFNNAGE